MGKEQQAVADQVFRQELETISLRAYPPLTLHEKLWQVKRLRALLASRAAEVGA